MTTAELRRDAQKAETWIRNVMRIYGWDHEKAFSEAKKHFKILNPGDDETLYFDRVRDIKH